MKFLSVFSGSSRSVLKHNSFRLAFGEKSLNKWNGGGCERNDREKMITALILDSEVQFFVPIFKFLFDFIFVVCWWQITVVRSPQSKSIHQPLLASSGSTPRNLVTCTTLTHVLHHSKPHHLRHPLITRPPRGTSTLTTHINYLVWQVFHGIPWLANFLDHLVCAIEKWLTAIVRGVGGFFRGVSPRLICESRHKSTCSVLCSRDRKGNCVISRNCALDGAPSRFDPALAIPGRNE